MGSFTISLGNLSTSILEYMTVLSLESNAVLDIEYHALIVNFLCNLLPLAKSTPTWSSAAMNVSSSNFQINLTGKPFRSVPLYPFLPVAVLGKILIYVLINRWL